MQVEVVVLLLFLFSGVWSVPSLPGIATGFVYDFLHVTLLLGFFFSFFLAASRRAKESVSHFSLLTTGILLRFGTILYEQAFIFKRALGAVVASSFRCRGVLSISATLQAAQPAIFVRQRSSKLPIF